MPEYSCCSLEENPGLSIFRRSHELGIPQTSLRRILHKDWSLKATQETKPLNLHVESSQIVFSLEEVITIGHRDLMI